MLWRSLAACARWGNSTRAATRILSATSSAQWSISLFCLISGLAIKSTAPSSSEVRVASDPLAVSEETITTGIGRRRIRRERNSSPFIRGISISSVSTSGLNFLMSSRAVIGSAAVATISISCCWLTTAVIMLRIRAESSTHSTRILFNVLSPLVHTPTVRAGGMGFAGG